MAIPRIEVKTGVYVPIASIKDYAANPHEVRGPAKKMDWGGKEVFPGEVLRSYMRVTITALDGCKYVLNEELSAVAYDVLFRSGEADDK